VKIIGSRTSPFVRIIRVLCAELNIEYQLDEIPPFPKMVREDIDHIKQNNPLMKVPVLIDGTQTILDSRIIASYLLQKSSPSHPHLNFPFNLDEENKISVIYGVLDSGILRFIMTQEKIDLNTGYMKKSYERMDAGLSFLNQKATNNQNFGFYTIALICGLEWLEKRQIFDWSPFENIKQIHTLYKDRASFVQTQIPENA
jgi:glutathione S-transferase